MSSQNQPASSGEAGVRRPSQGAPAAMIRRPALFVAAEWPVTDPTNAGASGQTASSSASVGYRPSRSSQWAHCMA